MAPSIRTINAGELGLRPTDRGADANVQAARRVGVFFNQVAQDQRSQGRDLASAVEVGGKTAVDYIDHQQITAGMKNYAALDLQLTQAWDAVLKGADGDDPAVAANFRESVVEPAIEKFEEGFMTSRGQEWAQQRSQALRNHFTHKTIADQSSLAMLGVRDSILKTTNAYTTKVAIDPSETTLRDTLSQVDSDIKWFVGSSPALSAEDGIRVSGELSFKMKEQVVKAGITAAIAKAPDVGLKMAQNKDFAPYLNGAEVNAFHAQAKRAAKADEVNARQLREQQLKETSERNSEAILADIHSDNPQWTAQKILQLPADQLSYERRKDLVGAIEKRDHSPANAQAEAGKMIVDIHAGKIKSEDEIVKALSDGRIDITRYKEVRKEFDDMKAPGGETLKQARSDFMSQYEKVVNPYDRVLGYSEEGWKRAYQLQMFARQQEEALRVAGKDPHVLYDPRSLEFLGLSPYAKPMASSELLRVNAARTVPFGPPKPGEVESPPAKYPDAFKGADGKWHVKRNGKSFTVIGE